MVRFTRDRVAQQSARAGEEMMMNPDDVDEWFGFCHGWISIGTIGFLATHTMDPEVAHIIASLHARVTALERDPLTFGVRLLESIKNHEGSNCHGDHHLR